MIIVRLHDDSLVLESNIFKLVSIWVFVIIGKLISLDFITIEVMLDKCVTNSKHLFEYKIELSRKWYQNGLLVTGQEKRGFSYYII